MIRWRMVVSIAALIGGLSLLGAGAPADSAPTQQLVLTGHRGHSSQDLAISGGGLRDLHPGAVRRISITFSNRNRFAIKVIAARAELIGTSRRGCKAIPANFQIRDYRGQLPLKVAPHSRRTGGYIEVRMPHTVSPACQHTRFSIRLIGKATKAER